MAMEGGSSGAGASGQSLALQPALQPTAAVTDVEADNLSGLRPVLQCAVRFPFFPPPFRC